VNLPFRSIENRCFCFFFVVTHPSKSSILEPELVGIVLGTS